jgi:23S rRNA (uracil1939-C5)-methyltransferase
MDKPGKNELIQLKIQDIGFEGSGIGKTENNFAVFVPNSVPGDTLIAKINKTRKNLAEAVLVEILEPSVYRVEPDCAHFGICNGCKIQNIIYSKQLEIKRNNVSNAFKRIGGFEDIFVPEVIPADMQFYYRNKLEFSFSANRWLTEVDLNKPETEKSFALGFHKPGFIDKVVDINKCLLQSDISNRILNFTRDFFKQRNISIYSTKTHEGFLRFLIIRQSANVNDVLINIITSEANETLMREYSECILNDLNCCDDSVRIDTDSLSIIHSISSAKANAAIASEYFVLHGKGYLEEKIRDMIFKISPFSFFQTNTNQCEKLFDTIVKIADFDKKDRILDLYCGCGAISLFISGMVKSVLGVELSSESINSAIENASINKIINCEFQAYDVKDFLKSILAANALEPLYDTIVLDPPRSGIHPKAAEYLLLLEPEKIIYVSCNPTTQARDIKLLTDKYQISAIQPVDMFPHTFHIENVVRLDKK